MFFDETVNVARYDRPRYPFFEGLTDKQTGFFWQPQEVDIYKDAKDFKALSDHEKHIFTSNLNRQFLLDSIQGRGPSLGFLPICSSPELEVWLQTWAFFETIHSRSYTYILKNVYPDASKVFDEMLDIKEIVECANDISEYYDQLIFANNVTDVFSTKSKESVFAHKTVLWLALNSVNILEGIRFYSSFACSWAFAETKRMEGNAKIIKFIARDENLHLASTQQMLRLLPKEDNDFLVIQEQCKETVEKMFFSAAEQEKQWAKYLFKDGSVIGLNEELLCQYIEYITNKRMTTLGYNKPFDITTDPLPWTQKWISGGEVQAAAQEVNLSSYVVSGTDLDLKEQTFKGFTL
jgi:ribonucleoside-diphosphate reductase beta chain